MAWFVWNGYPWFVRSARDIYGSSAGVFTFTNDNGYSNGAVSFRVASLL